MLADLLPAQAARGWQVAVAAPAGSGLDEVARASGGALHDWVPGARPGPGFAATLRRLSAIVRDVDPDLVHLHTSMAGMCGRLVVRGRRPTVFQPHSWSFFAVPGLAGRGAVIWERFAARWAHVVLCVSADEKAHGQRLGITPGRYAVVPNGVDLERFAPRERGAARLALQLSDEPLVVCSGRLHRQKGQQRLLDAWPAVLDAVPTARLALLGEGPDRQALQARQVPQTLFIGRSDDVPQWLAASDVVVQPSSWEGMSLSLLEAMACARSVVVTDVPGMREVVVPGTGALVPLDHASALAHALITRLSSPGLSAAEGAAGRALVQSEHDLSVQRERLLDELAALLSVPQ